MTRIASYRLRSDFDNLDISVAVVYPEMTPLAIVQFSHGMCGCKERFFPTMEHLASKGFICVANDHRGHGESIINDEDLGFMYKGGYRALVADMRKVTEDIKGRHPGLPFFLIGHSMGSLAARVYIKECDKGLDGLVVCGSPSRNPFSILGLALSSILPGRHRMRLTQRITSEGFNRRFRNEGHQAWTCSDPAVRKAFMDNPKCNFAFTANASKALMHLMNETYSLKRWNVTRPDLPILFLTGEDDPCIKSMKKLEDSIEHMKKAGYSNIRSITYPGMRHEVLNEKDRESAWNDIRIFIENNL